MSANSPVPIAVLAAALVPGVTLGPNTVAVLLVVALLIILVGGVKLYDLHRKREADAVHLQAQVSDAMLRDGRLFGLPVTATADVPMFGRAPATLQVSGQIPSEELRDVILRTAEEEARRVRPDVVVEDRLLVVPTMVARSA